VQKAKVEMTLPIECMSANTVTGRNYFVLGLISLVTGFCYYVFFRERSAYFVKTPLSSINIPTVFCNFIPDFLWAVSFTAMLLWSGISIRYSCFIVIVLGAFFEAWQLVTGIGGASISDVIAYTTGAVSTHLLAGLPKLITKAGKNN